jgi:hypothetical protein
MMRFLHIFFFEVSRMAEEIRLRFPRLNTLIACASVVVPRRIKSQDGLELTLQVCASYNQLLIYFPKSYFSLFLLNNYY